MNLKIKLELLNIMFLRTDEANAAARTDFPALFELFKVTTTLKKDIDRLNKMSELLGLNSRKAIQINHNVRNIQKSWRWRIGNQLVSIIERIVRRRYKVTALNAIEKDSESIMLKYRNFINNPVEPEHFLNPCFKIPRRNFHFGDKKEDGSISIIILNKDGADQLELLFNSFLKYNTYENFTITIIDHHSTDASIPLISRYREVLPIRLQRLSENITFSYSNNYAVQNVEAEFLFFLNNDIIFESDVLEAFIRHFKKDPGVGIVGALLYYPTEKGDNSGKIQHAGIKFRFEYKPPEAGLRNADNICPNILRPYNLQSEPDPGFEDYPAVTGAAMMIRKSDFVQLGGFDENYIWGYEDVDLCLKCQAKLNKKIRLAADITLIHDESSTRKDKHFFSSVIRDHNLNMLQKGYGRLIMDKCFEDVRLERNNWLGSGFLDLSMIARYNSGQQTANCLKTIKKRADSSKKTRIAIKISVPTKDQAEMWGDYHFAASLSKSFEKLGFCTRIDFLPEWYNHGYLEDDVVIVLRGLKRYYSQPGPLNFMWNISHPDLICDEEYESFDHVFVASAGHAQALSGKLSVPVTQLLQCTDPELFYPYPDNSDPVRSYIFVGNSRGQMRKIVKYSVKNSIAVEVFGNGWHGKIPEELMRGNFIPHAVLRDFYSQSRLVFNDHWKDMAENGFISNRIFDAIASGSPVITDYVEGIEEIFGNGALQFKSEEDFLEVLYKFEEDPRKYKSLAESCSRIIRENHTFEKRAVAIASCISLFFQMQKFRVEESMI
jgi:O-antigen biosynthesis protein